MTNQEIGDHAQIAQVLARYAFAIDRKDLDLLLAVFTPDATIDYAVARGTKLGFLEMMSWLRTALAMFRVTQHALALPLVEIDGIHARSTTNVIATHVQVPLAGGDEVYTVLHGVYTDRLVQTELGWRIAERRLEELYTKGQFIPPEESRQFPVAPPTVAAKP